MKRTLISLLTLTVWTFGAAQLLAHEEYRIVGTIAKVEKTELQVKASKDGKIYKIALDDLTVVRRDKDKVGRAELKTGRSVVVNALGDSLEDLVAVEIRLVADLPKSSGRE